MMILIYSHTCLSSGVIKLSLPGSALLDCARTEPPGNTMLKDINPVRVGVTTMEQYLPLVLRLFELTPEGILSYAKGEFQKKIVLHVGSHGKQKPIK